MADNPLFYRSIVPLNREQHRDLKLRATERPFDFARGSHVIPALAEEFGAACRHMPIVFLIGTGAPTAVFLAGVRPGSNSFVNEAGAWTGGYVPAYLRRYPFIVGEAPGADPVICIDPTFEGAGRESGEPLFNPDGSDAPLLSDRITFSNEYLRAARVTDDLMKRVQDFDLLRPISIEVRTAAGASAAVHGVFAIDEAKLTALPDERFLRLRQDGMLGPLYAHLLSLTAVDRLSGEVQSPG